MTDAQRENLRALLLAARRKAENIYLCYGDGPIPPHAVVKLTADLDSALRELEEGADG